MKIKSKKAFPVKYQFIKHNFFILFCSFVLPLLLLGMILIFLSWQKTSDEIQKRIDNTQILAANYLESFRNSSQTVNLYLENSSLMLGINRMMNFKDISYTESVILKQFSLFISSYTNSSPDMDSLYVYIPNSLNRVYTSGSQFVFLDSLSDRKWEERLTTSSQLTWVEARKKKDYPFENPRSVLTIYNRFRTYPGGWIANYSLSNIIHYYDSLLSFPHQSILLFDSLGNCILKSSGCTDEMAAAISHKFDSGVSSIHLKNIPYTFETSYYEPYQIHIVTLMPQSIYYTKALENAFHTILLIILVIIIILIMAYLLSLKSYHQLNQIVEWFNQAEHHLPLKPMEKGDMYSHILQNIIRVFLENDYLQVQLSERKFRQRAAELLALQYQINPHFLFNTLQTINYEVLTITQGKQVKANQMIGWLSDILRFSLSSSELLITLRQETDNCKKYIKIQQERYQNGFTVEWKIPTNLLSLEIPRLILQPIIENSITHGIRYMECGKIRVTVKEDRDIYRFEILDNGVGIEHNELEKLQEKLMPSQLEYMSEHIGLQNCSERLIMTFSPDSYIHIQSKKGMGSLIRFEIPKKY